MMKRKCLVLRFSEVARRINPQISPPYHFAPELYSCLSSRAVGWMGLILQCPDDVRGVGAYSFLILFFQNAPAVRRSVTPARNLLHPRHLLSPGVGPHTSLGSIWAHSSMAQNLETTKGKWWKYLVRRLSAGLIICIVWQDWNYVDIVICSSIICPLQV